MTHLEIPENKNINNIDIITLLGNLLDNATEACLQLKYSDKVIHLLIS